VHTRRLRLSHLSPNYAHYLKLLILRHTLTSLYCNVCLVLVVDIAKHSYVWNFTSVGWSTRSVEQLREVNEGWVRTTARLLHKEHVVQVHALTSYTLTYAEACSIALCTLCWKQAAWTVLSE
jgi:hypothetical protein